MEQHPVPQNISSYEFRLVGDMTLKQFFELAGGVLAGLGIFKLPLPPLIKLPLVALAVLTGVLMAFVPIQGRPFNQWITAFIRAIYAPTEFYWVAATSAATTPPPLPSEAPKSEGGLTPLDQLESQIISRVTSIFSQPLHRTQRPPTPLSPADVAKFTPPAPAVSPPPRSEQTVYVKAAPIPTPAPISQPAPSAPAAPSPAEALAKAGPIPQVGDIPLGPTHLTPIVHHALSSRESQATAAASAPSVATPSSPNLLAGIVMGSQGQTIEGAIVEIIDAGSALPVRALRTNRLGQFQIATPLPLGSYIVRAEKDGLDFEPVTVSAEGQIISPITIQTKTSNA